MRELLREQGWARDIAIVVGSLALGFTWLGFVTLITGGNLDLAIAGGVAWCVGRGAFPQ